MMKQRSKKTTDANRKSMDRKGLLQKLSSVPTLVTTSD
jgi:hypothetical protein